MISVLCETTSGAVGNTNSAFENVELTIDVGRCGLGRKKNQAKYLIFK